MRKTIDNLKAEIQNDVCIYHDPVGLYHVLGQAPDGEPSLGDVFYTSEGRKVIVQRVITLADEPRAFKQSFHTFDGAVTKTKPKKKKATEVID